MLSPDVDSPVSNQLSGIHLSVNFCHIKQPKLQNCAKSYTNNKFKVKAQSMTITTKVEKYVNSAAAVNRR